MRFNIKVFLFFLIFSLFGLMSNFLVFKSFILQRIILSDFNSGNISLTYDNLNDYNFDYPNINNFTIPLKAYKAYYLYNNQKPLEALDLLNNTDFIKINPYIKFEDFVKSNIFLNLNQIDSAFFYSKSAFYKWPKSLQHFQLLNKISIIKRDTTEILKAFDLIDSIYYDRSEYQKTFLQSLAKAKLSYLVKYDSIRTIKKEELIGSWNRVLEYEGNNIQFYNNSTINFTEDFYFTETDTLKYSINNTSLILSPVFRKDYQLSKSEIRYSNSHNTLILIPDQESGNIQARYYKKVK